MSAIAQVVSSRRRDIGSFEVRRILPFGGGHMVGPFIFLDHMGPVTFAVGQGIDVRLHPHVCLATVTYLFEGEIEHRDSLGVVQTIRPGDVNWMTAGSGIVHSERTGLRLRVIAGEAFGLRSPVPVFSGMFYADARLDRGATLDMPRDHAERAARRQAPYLVEFRGELARTHRAREARMGGRKVSAGSGRDRVHPVA
jgi:redox-sensitive bicupin YhaK (pirin superfamily)